MKKRFLFNYTRATEFRDSFIKVVDTRDKTTTTYLAERFLGEGGYGVVRLFSNGNHQFAVKAPVPPEICVSDDHIKTQIDAIQNESSAMESAYPDDFYSLSIYQESTSTGDTEVDYRFIMPLAEGMTVFELSEQLSRGRELAKLILRISQEVLRVNRLGIIHCDPNSGNIFVVKKNHDYFIHLIDFGISVKIGEVDVDFHKLIYGSNARVANEVAKGPISRGHQVDIFASSIEWLIKRFKSIHREPNLRIIFPSIQEFIKKAENIELSDRQSLTTFITALSAEILNLDPLSSLNEICSALFTHREKSLKKRLQSDTDNNAFELLSKLIKHHFYRELKMMLEAKEDLLNVSTLELKILFAQIAIDQHFPPALLREIFVLHLTNEAQKELLINPVQDKNTLLHLVFENKQVEFVDILFQRLSKLFPETKISDIGEAIRDLYAMSQQDKKTAIDLVIHILHLYIEKASLASSEPNRLFKHKYKNAHYDLAHRIASCEHLFTLMKPGDDPFQKIRDDFYLPLVDHFNLKSHSKKYHDDVLRDIFGRIVGANNIQKKRL